MRGKKPWQVEHGLLPQGVDALVSTDTGETPVVVLAPGVKFGEVADDLAEFQVN